MYISKLSCAESNLFEGARVADQGALASGIGRAPAPWAQPRPRGAVWGRGLPYIASTTNRRNCGLVIMHRWSCALMNHAAPNQSPRELPGGAISGIARAELTPGIPDDGEVSVGRSCRRGGVLPPRRATRPRTRHGVRRPSSRKGKKKNRDGSCVRAVRIHVIRRSRQGGTCRRPQSVVRTSGCSGQIESMKSARCAAHRGFLRS